MDEVIPIIRGGNICKKNSEEGKLHVVNLNGLLACPRKYVYICGLSANEFPGGAKENYLLLDTDLQNFEGSVLSQQKILNNIQLFENVTSFIESLSCKQKLSFSYYDLADLKKQNASSVLYKLFDDVSKIPKVNYFESHLSASREVCDKYKNGTEVNYEVDAPQVSAEADLIERKWSFSAINTYFECPRKFYLSYVLGIPDVAPTDPFEVLNAADIGTIAHNMMEYLGKFRPAKDVFLDECGKAFEDAVALKPALIEAKMQSAKDEFLDMMRLAYDFDIKNSNDVELSEKYLSAKHDKSGLNLVGKPDRIEHDGHNNFVIDFKTGREIKHIENDPKSCLQAIIYAFLCEQNSPVMKIAKGEFRYLRNSGVVECAYNIEAKQAMDEALEEFANGLKDNNFERCAKNCKYCSYGSICL